MVRIYFAVRNWSPSLAAGPDAGEILSMCVIQAGPNKTQEFLWQIFSWRGRVILPMQGCGSTRGKEFIWSASSLAWSDGYLYAKKLVISLCLCHGPHFGCAISPLKIRGTANSPELGVFTQLDWSLMCSLQAAWQGGRRLASRQVVVVRKLC